MMVWTCSVPKTGRPFKWSTFCLKLEKFWRIQLYRIRMYNNFWRTKSILMLWLLRFSGLRRSTVTFIFDFLNAPKTRLCSGPEVHWRLSESTLDKQKFNVTRRLSSSDGLQSYSKVFILSHSRARCALQLSGRRTVNLQHFQMDKWSYKNAYGVQLCRAQLRQA